MSKLSDELKALAVLRDAGHISEDQLREMMQKICTGNKDIKSENHSESGENKENIYENNGNASDKNTSEKNNMKSLHGNNDDDGKEKPEISKSKKRKCLNKDSSKEDGELPDLRHDNEDEKSSSKNDENTEDNNCEENHENDTGDKDRVPIITQSKTSDDEEEVEVPELRHDGDKNSSSENDENTEDSNDDENHENDSVDKDKNHSRLTINQPNKRLKREIGIPVQQARPDRKPQPNISQTQSKSTSDIVKLTFSHISNRGNNKMTFTVKKYEKLERFMKRFCHDYDLFYEAMSFRFDGQPVQAHMKIGGKYLQMMPDDDGIEIDVHLRQTAGANF